MPSIDSLFKFDSLSIIMMCLVGFVGLCVASFSSRYLKGDRQQKTVYIYLVALIFSVIGMVSADHIAVLFISWAASNLILTQLMLHKRQWSAARKSSWLALKNFALGLVFLAGALSILYCVTKETSIQAIINTPLDSGWMLFSSLLICLTAMSQSSLWPFHRWLTSSLNSPTPVSALMHAGLVNGGGFILARFAPLFLGQPSLLNILFVMGISTALLGTLWKLMQTDIKRMLACSTMGQMGFMVAQCGLGLFPAAVAHLCWHGLFKAYLFLASGSAAQEKRLDIEYPPRIIHFFLALICGVATAYTFSWVTGKNILALDTTLFLILLSLIAGAQYALPIIRQQAIIKLPLTMIGNLFIGGIYGVSVHMIEIVLAPMSISVPQPLTMVHVIALIVLSAAWLTILFRRTNNTKYRDYVLRAYVHMLNASQPHPDTITAHRNQYQF